MAQTTGTAASMLGYNELNAYTFDDTRNTYLKTQPTVLATVNTASFIYDVTTNSVNGGPTCLASTSPLLLGTADRFLQITATATTQNAVAGFVAKLGAYLPSVSSTSLTFNGIEDGETLSSALLAPSSQLVTIFGAFNAGTTPTSVQVYSVGGGSPIKTADASVNGAMTTAIAPFYAPDGSYFVVLVGKTLKFFANDLTKQYAATSATGIASSLTKSAFIGSSKKIVSLFGTTSPSVVVHDTTSATSSVAPTASTPVVLTSLAALTGKTVSGTALSKDGSTILVICNDGTLVKLTSSLWTSGNITATTLTYRLGTVGVTYFSEQNSYYHLDGVSLSPDGVLGVFFSRAYAAGATTYTCYVLNMTAGTLYTSFTAGSTNQTPYALCGNLRSIVPVLPVAASLPTYDVTKPLVDLRAGR